MSFGKDPKTLGAVGSYRQMGNRITKRPVRASGGGGMMFRDKFRPSLVAPDAIRLVAGNYIVPILDNNDNVIEVPMPNFKCREHYYARNKRTCICSGGPLAEVKGKRDPCLGCDTFWAGWHTDEKGKKKRGPMGMSDSYIFNVLHYANYHEAEQTDKAGNIVTGPQGNPYMEWVVCESTYGTQCKNCQLGKKTELGRLLHWSMGFGHYQTVLAADEQIGRSCASCSTRDSINWQAWLCQGPNCGEAVIERSSTSMTAEDIKKTVIDEVKCRSCGFFGFLQEYVECNNCAKPVRASLFDVDMNAMRVKQGRGDSETTVLQISQWSEPRPIDARFAPKAKALALDKIYAPTPIDKQAEYFQLPLPDGTQPRQPQRQPEPEQPGTGIALPDQNARPYSGQGMYKP